MPTGGISKIDFLNISKFVWLVLIFDLLAGSLYQCLKLGTDSLGVDIDWLRGDSCRKYGKSFMP
jgi:hypothetical protein